jgi:myosin III
LQTRAKYKFKSRSDNEPHIYSVADSAYQDAMHHDEPQYIIFSGESGSGKTTNVFHAMRQLIYIGEVFNATGNRVEKAMKILQAATSAGTCINPNSTRCVLQAQMTYGKSGKFSGAIFWMYQLEKWRVSSTDLLVQYIEFYFNELFTFNVSEIKATST